MRFLVSERRRVASDLMLSLPKSSARVLMSCALQLTKVRGVGPLSSFLLRYIKQHTKEQMQPVPEHLAEKRRSMVEIRLRMNHVGMLTLPSSWNAPLYRKPYWLRKAHETGPGDVIRPDSQMILMTDRHRRCPTHTAATKACVALCDVFRHFKKSMADAQ